MADQFTKANRQAKADWDDSMAWGLIEDHLKGGLMCEPNYTSIWLGNDGGGDKALWFTDYPDGWVWFFRVQFGIPSYVSYDEAYSLLMAANKRGVEEKARYRYTTISIDLVNRLIDGFQDMTDDVWRG